ncbi:MAG: GFA family protein [Pseudomonadaceae bacterium]|nr:GFA family protein [Pseudomonadaceae bacterium]
MFEGSCLCGQVKYEVDCEPQPMGHCHCHTCRKAHSAAFSTVMSVPRAVFSWRQGEDQLSSYESSPGKKRFFCSGCGSQLIASREATDYVLIRVGSIDSVIKQRPKVHFWCSDGASWYDPEEELPILPKGVPD